MIITKDLLVAVLCTFCLTSTLFMTLPTISSPDTGEYDPWVDINDDGAINYLDAILLGSAFDTMGDPFLTKAGLTYDSGWVDITDKCGQYFNITHDLNSTDIIVDITGKTTQDGGSHRRHLGGTGYLQKITYTTQLPNPSATHHATVHNNRIYVVGGKTPTSGVHYDRVLYGSVQPDGHVDTNGWQYTTPLPQDGTGQSERANAPVVVYEDWIYVLDGNAEEPPHLIERDTVCFAQIYPNGTIGCWNWSTSTPYRGCEEAVQWNGRIYILAGWDGYSEHDDVYFAEINQTDGSLGSWNSTTSLPREIAHGHATVAHNGVIYFIGGGEAYPQSLRREVYYSIINETTGEVGDWIETAALPTPLQNHDAVVYCDHVYVIGGTDEYGNVSDKVYRAQIRSNGSLGDWEEYCVLPEPLSYVSAVCLNERIYVIGGCAHANATEVDTVYFIETKEFEYGLAWMDSTADTITLYRGATDAYWNCVRVRIWKIKETP